MRLLNFSPSFTAPIKRLNTVRVTAGWEPTLRMIPWYIFS